MRLDSNAMETIWYVRDNDDKIIFVSMFKEQALEYIETRGDEDDV